MIDGAIRDVAAFAASDFPCFARTVIHRGPYKSGPGEINVPVSIGGSVISPGDIVVGDEDGVVSFPAATAATLLEAVRAQIAREEETLISIREGRYQGSYGKILIDARSADAEGGTMSQKDEFHNLDNPADGLFRELASGVTTRIFSGEHAMLSVVTLAPHAQGTLHHHPEEQWGVLLDGSADPGSGR